MLALLLNLGFAASGADAPEEVGALTGTLTLAAVYSGACTIASKYSATLALTRSLSGSLTVEPE